MSKEQFVGTYKLIAMEGRMSSGDIIYPYGEHPNGLITYTPNGWMSGHIFSQDRRAVASADLGLATAEEARALVRGTVSYFGTYDVDDAQKVVTHHVLGALNVAWEGGDQRRFFELSGNRITLRTPPLPTDGQTAVHVLIWERIS